MPTEAVRFAGHAGHDLAARLDLPVGPVLATALFAHCFTCGKDIHAARRISARLACMGIAVLRFDFTGLGHSDGEFANTSFSSNVEDLAAAARYLESRDMAPTLLIGHSLGGAAVIRACEHIPSARAVVTIGAPYDLAHVIRHFRRSLDDIRSHGEAEVTVGGRPFRIGKAFFEDISSTALGSALARLRAALLVMHAPRDEIVGIDNAAAIFRAARHPKSFITLDDADHLISRPGDAEYAAEVIAAWSRRYLELQPPPAPPGAPEGIVRVTEADPEGFLQDVQAGPYHHVLADEPKSLGGTDRGMSPYGFLAAGLGACTSMTVRLYARRKNWPLTGITVDVSHDRIHARDARDDRKARIDRFTRRIRLDGPLDSAQRSRLLEIADKCPVHRTLSHGAVIETMLEDG